MSDTSPTMPGMGAMGLLPRRRAPARGEEARGAVRPVGGSRVEVDTEAHRFVAGGAYSFWSAVKYIFVLSLLLWWLPQNVGAMVAGYVGGRRAGSHWRAVLAALVPVVILYVGQWLGGHPIGVGPITFVSSLPSSIAFGIAAAIPPAQPYVEFLASYFGTFVQALQTTFGMQTSGYLIVIVFAYIGGIIGEQSRLESGEALPSTSVNVVHPIVERLRVVTRGARGTASHTAPRLHPGIVVSSAEKPWHRPIVWGREPMHFHNYRQLDAVVEPHRRVPAPRAVHPKPPAREVPHEPQPETHRHDPDRDRAVQRFVERALAEYDRPHGRVH